MNKMEKDYYEVFGDNPKCINCGEEMNKFFWGEKHKATCPHCGFKHPCCE